MMPIQDFLNRIRWDKEFGKSDFEVGYYDHVEQKIIRIPFQRLGFEEGNRFSFQFHTDTGELRNIPFHHVREVYKDGERIWYRRFVGPL